MDIVEISWKHIDEVVYKIWGRLEWFKLVSRQNALSMICNIQKTIRQ